MKVDKSKKPNVKLDVECPHCQSVLRVKFWKQREQPAEPPDYMIDVEAEVLKQGKLFPGENAEAD